MPSSAVSRLPGIGLRDGAVDPNSASEAICFGPFRLETDGVLFRGNQIVHLPPRELAALRLLLAHAGQIVSSLQLKKEVWGEVNVTPDSVPKCLSSLRALLEPSECIQTVYKRGYRFAAPVARCGQVPQNPLPRLAILPFAAGYGVPEHLGSAIAEEATTRLTNTPSIPVALVARDSVFTLAKRGYTAQQLGAALNASLVLTGTLLALPSCYRLRVEMVHVEQGTQIWVEDMLVHRDQPAALETELVQRLAMRLGAPAGISISAVAEDHTAPQRRDAYQIFQQARYEWRTLERHRMQDGLQHLTHAAELDPSLIPAKVDLAHLCVAQELYGFMSPSVAANLVRRTAESIPELPYRAGAILPALGWVSFHVDHNLPAALHAFSQSHDLPHDSSTTRVRAMLALSRHKFDEAIDLLQGALRIDPYSPWLHNRLAWTFHLNRQAGESVKQIEEGIVRFPEHEATCVYGTMILAYNGMPDRALRLAEGMAARLPYFDLATSVYAYALACARRKDEARLTLERLQWLGRERFVLRSFNPAGYLALGDPESAMAELRAAAVNRCPWFFQMLADPRLEPLFGHPEFQEMNAQLARMEASVEQA